jgi:hypothetical protein
MNNIKNLVIETSIKSAVNFITCTVLIGTSYMVYAVYDVCRNGKKKKDVQTKVDIKYD